jgi:hypothetical protein
MAALKSLFRRNRNHLRNPSAPSRNRINATRVERLEDRAMLAAFTPGNLAVYRVGTGAAALTNAATDVFVDEYTTSGTLVQSIALPTAASGANSPLTASGSATSEGSMTLSSNGSFLVLTGYASAPGTASIASSSTGTVPRTIGRIAADGTVDTSTTTTSFSGNNIRSAASVDGSGFWAVGGTSGVVYQGFGGSGAGTSVSGTPANLRTLGVYDGQLYVSTGSGSAVRLGTVGTGLPTTTGQTITNLPGFPTSGSPYQFFMADLDASPGIDTVYIADDTGGAGVRKYSLVSGSWALNGTITGTSVRGLTGSVSSGTVTLYATSNGTGLGSVIDTAGYNAAPSTTTLTSIITAATNTAIRGVALVPTGGVVVTSPTLADPTATAVTNTTATLNGNVTSTGGDTVTSRGFVYSVTSLNNDPEIGGPNVIAVDGGAGPGAFSVAVSSLLPGTEYTLKAYAGNSEGVAYSNAITFTTNAAATAPVVVSPTATSIIDISATLGGTVSSDGGATVTERGIVYALTADNAAPEIGGVDVTKVADAGTGTGTFAFSVTGLTPSSGYSYRPYAINSEGVSYSDVATFTTNVAATAPVIGTPTKTNIGSTTATLGGQITSNGGRPLTGRGVIFSKTADNADPVIGGPGVTNVPSGTLFTGTFTVAVTGLEVLTGYTFKAYATNDVGTSYTTLDTFTTFDTPTTLSAGDVAFTGIDPAAGDKLSFVLLKDVVAGTTMVLTDNTWTGSALSSNEGTSTITFTQAFTAGTLFDYDGARTAGQKWQAGGNTVSPSTAGLTDVTTGNFGINASGDNVFAYQGTAPTGGSDSNWMAAVATLPFLTTGTTTTTTTYLPPALTEGSTAFSLNYAPADPQVGQLSNLGTLTDSAAGLRTTIYTATNWSTDVTTFPQGTVFVIGTPVSATQLAVTTAPVDYTYGDTFGLVVEARDGSNALVTGFTGDITIAIATGTGVLAGTTTVAAVDGVATFTGLSLSNVGSFTFDVTSGSLTATTTSVNVAQKALTISGLSTSNKPYDGGTSASVTGTGSLVGIVGSDDVSLSGTASGTFNSPNVNAATEVAVSGLSLGGTTAGNYTLSPLSLPASITPVSLTVTANNAQRVVNTANPTFTATITGFVNSETTAVLTGSPDLTTTATIGSAVGTYPITAAVGTLAANNDNYTFGTFTDGTLTIVNPPVTVTGVYVRGSAWNTTYLNLSPFTTIGTDKLGWLLPDGAAQVANSSTVSWNNVNTVSVKFNQAIALPASSALALVRGTSGGNVVIPPTGVMLLAGGTIAQWTLPASLATGKYYISIVSTGITDAADTTTLDGEWTTSSSTYAAGSGNGTAGGIFNFLFNVLVADMNANGTANSVDISNQRSNILVTLGTLPSATTFRFDINGNNTINSTDVSQARASLASALGTPLASLPTPTAPVEIAPTSGSGATLALFAWYASIDTGSTKKN